MNIHIFGTLGGSEPVAGHQHTSLAVEANENLYWFDAGEGCSRTAYLMGVDLMSIRKICISHTHMDHIGGLGNLIWTIRRLDRTNHNLKNRVIDVYVPEPEIFNHILAVAKGPDEVFTTAFTFQVHPCRDDVLFHDDGVLVTGRHTRHLPPGPDGNGRSYAFSLSAEQKKIVFSGDTSTVEELYPLLGDCDLLLMETGHHQPEAVANCLIRDGKLPAHLAFLHHGWTILKDRTGQESRLRDLLGDAFSILEDGMTLTL